MSVTDADFINAFLAPQQSRPQVRSAPSQSNPIDGLVRSLAGMDPTQRTIAITLVRDQLPMLRGVPLSEAEQQMEALRVEAERTELERRISRNNVQDVVGWLMDNRAQKLSNGQTVEEAVGVGQLDQGLLDDPDKLAHASNIAAQLTGRDHFKLSPSMMLKSGFEGLTKSRVERERDRIAGDVQAEKTATTRLEQRAAAAEGEGATAAAIGAGMQAAEQARGGGFFGVFDSDIDEPRGSDEFRRASLASLGTAQRETGASGGGAVEAFIGQFGEEIKDQLEGLAQNEKGELILGSSDAGIAPEASINLGLLVDDMSRVMGVSTATLMRQMGLEYTGIDAGSLSAARSFVNQSQAGTSDQR